MKRSGPLRRRKPLRSNAATVREWEKRTRQRRLDDPDHAETVRQTLARDRRAHSSLAQAKEEARWRSGGMCEANVDDVCPPWRHRAQHFHHRRLRAQGGADSAENLAHICITAHEWAHAHPIEARKLGLIIGFAEATP